MGSPTLQRLIERRWAIECKLRAQKSWGAATTAYLEELSNINRQIAGYRSYYNAKHGRSKE